MKQNQLTKLAHRLSPELDELSGVHYTGQLLNVFFGLYSGIISIIGLTWLISITDLSIVSNAGWVLAGLFVLAYLFNHYTFELYFELRPGVILTTSGFLMFVAVLSAAFVFGPTLYWLSILTLLLAFWRDPDPHTDPHIRPAVPRPTCTGLAPGE